jgi:hypothetical protein
LTAFEASFYYLTFVGKTFSTIQNGGFFEDDVIFEKKSTFFQKSSTHPKLNFFKVSKSKLVVQRPKMYQKNCQRKFSKMADVFKMAFVLFSI